MNVQKKVFTYSDRRSRLGDLLLSLDRDLCLLSRDRRPRDRDLERRLRDWGCWLGVKMWNNAGSGTLTTLIF